MQHQENELAGPAIRLSLPLAEAFASTGDTVSDAINKAALLQLIWDSQDDAGETVMSLSEMMRRTGGPKRPLRRAMLSLRETGMVSHRRVGSYDSTYVYVVDFKAVRAMIP